MNFVQQVQGVPGNMAVQQVQGVPGNMAVAWLIVLNV